MVIWFGYVIYVQSQLDVEFILAVYKLYTVYYSFSFSDEIRLENGSIRKMRLMTIMHERQYFQT
jgi:hypothetical protein